MEKEKENINNSFINKEILQLTDQTVNYCLDKNLRDQPESFEPQSFGKYHIIFGEFGEGAFCKVVKALDRNTSKHLALKFPSNRSKEEPQKIVEMMTKENEFLKEINSFDSKGLFLGYKGFKKKNEMVFIGLEAGVTSLKNILKNGKIYDQEEAIYVLGRLLQQLSYLESQGIANSDIKSANMILVRLSNDNSPYFDYKIADFGISVKLKSCKKIIPLGMSRHYAAPEVVASYRSGNIEIDPFKSDVYSLGIIVLEMIGCHREKNQWRNYLKNKKEFEKIYEILDLMLHDKPDKRKSFVELQKVIEKYLQKPPTEETRFLYPIEEPEKSVQFLLLEFHGSFHHLKLVEESSEKISQIGKLIRAYEIKSELIAEWYHCKGIFKQFKCLEAYNDEKSRNLRKKKSKEYLTKAKKLYKKNNQLAKIGLVYCDLGFFKFYGRNGIEGQKKKFFKEFYKSQKIFEDLNSKLNCHKEKNYLALVPTFFNALNHFYFDKRAEARDETFKNFNKFFKLLNEFDPRIGFQIPIKHEDEIYLNMQSLEKYKIDIENRFLCERVKLFDKQQCEAASISNFYDNLAHFFLKINKYEYAFKLAKNSYEIRYHILQKDNVYVKYSSEFLEFIAKKKQIVLE